MLGFSDVGGTGTRAGMTTPQRRMAISLLQEFHPTTIHLGDCVGVDDQLRVMCQENFPSVQTIGHPPIDERYRAFGYFHEIRPPRDYLARDRAIVQESSLIMGFPKEITERKRGSGTWYTIRFARKLELPLVIVWPDGTIKWERM